MREEVVRLKRAADGALVDATLRVGVGPLDLVRAERAWGPARLDGIERALVRGDVVLPEHVHWNWA